MLEIKAKLKLARGARSTYGIEVKGRLELPFESRRNTRLRTTLSSGEDVALLLPRGEILRGGDLVVASDGRVIEVVARSESVLHITCATAQDLTRAAFRLGNRHVPVQIGEGFLRIAADHGLEDMLKGLGATVATMEEAFEPEAGAHGDAPAHGDDGHGHDHDHGHDHGHGHGHGHHHDHDCGHDHGRNST